MPDHVTIPDVAPRIEYTADGSQTEFPFAFPFFAATDIVVLLDGVAQVSGYTVSGVAADAGYSSGTVIFTSAPANEVVVRLDRSIPIQRLTDFPYPAQVLDIREANTELDRLFAIQQDQDLRLSDVERGERFLRVPDGETIAELPEAESRASKFLGFDSNGNPVLREGTGGVGEQGPPGQGAPIGAVIPWAAASPPNGWLLCYGQAVSRTTYADLYAVIGTQFGAGNGSTTFNVPDMRGRAVFGKDNMGSAAASRITLAVSGINAAALGATGGDQRRPAHSHGVSDPAHTHGGTTDSQGAHSHATGLRGSNNLISAGEDGAELSADGGGAFYSVTSAGDHTHNLTLNPSLTGVTVSSSGDGTAENMPPTLILNWIICAANTAYGGPSAGVGGATLFTELLDVPGDYTGHAGKVPVVNAGEDGLEFQARPVTLLVQFAGKVDAERQRFRLGAAAYSFLAAGTNHTVTCDTPPALSTTYTLTTAGVTVTATIGAGANEGTVTLSGDITTAAKELVVGDGPATADADAELISITLAGTRI